MEEHDIENILKKDCCCTINDSPVIEKVYNMFLVKKPMILSSTLFGMIRKFPSRVELKRYEWECIGELGLTALDDYEIRYYTHQDYRIGPIPKYWCGRDTMFTIDAARKICENEREKSNDDACRKLIDEIIRTLDNVETEYESMVDVMENSHIKEACRNGRT